MLRQSNYCTPPPQYATCRRTSWEKCHATESSFSLIDRALFLEMWLSAAVGLSQNSWASSHFR